MSAATPDALGDGRIGALDGMRAIACLAVVGFHFFTTWTLPRNTADLYPYGNVLAEVPLFAYGYLGVQLFFLVSGFVIALTLTRCASPQEFILRRFARLFPPMLVASAATYVVLRNLSPHYWTVGACYFLPSLTFVHPYVYDRLFGLTDCGFMDGAYWSLFIEVRFYAWAALLYFGLPRRWFLPGCAVLMGLGIADWLLRHVIHQSVTLVVGDLLLFSRYAPWLYSGVAFFALWTDPRDRLAWALVGVGFAASVLFSSIGAQGYEWAGVVALYGLFLAFVRHARAIRILEARWLTAVGAASYSLYLLHQQIGVTATAAIARALGWTGARSLVIPVVVAAALVLASIALYRYVEVPTRRWITGHGLRWLGIGRAPQNP